MGADPVGRLLRRRFKDTVRIVHMHDLAPHEAGRAPAVLPAGAPLHVVKADGTHLQIVRA